MRKQRPGGFRRMGTVLALAALQVWRRPLPEVLRVTATAADGTIMGVAHRTLPVEGVQFHPESIRSEHGHEMIGNFLRRCSNAAGVAA